LVDLDEDAGGASGETDLFVAAFLLGGFLPDALEHLGPVLE
jgi:hypothetical protein